MLPSCEVELVVQRATTLKVAPQQHVSLSCPVRHCGQSRNVTWCKQLDNCEPIISTESVEITEKDGHADELISYLTFKNISTDDDGLYRCHFKRHKEELISQAINVSVSGRDIFNYCPLPKIQVKMKNLQSQYKCCLNLQIYTRRLQVRTSIY